jgi:peptidyl-prolyl cis-trans isomerase B (cyclophilin B)
MINMNQIGTKLNFNFFLIICLISVISLSGCQQLNPDNSSRENSSQGTATISNNTANKMENKMNLPKLEGKAIVLMKVNGQSITIEVDGNNAPLTAGNFIDLVEKGVYDGLVFHRVVKEPQPFVVQGGDPQGKDPNFPISRLGTGSYIDPQTQSSRYIPLEIRPEYDETKENETPPEIIYSKTTDQTPELKHEYGVIAMARSQMPDSASSQFYFTLADLPFLDGNYAVFGKVTEGMEVVEQIKQGDRIESAEVISGAENLQD